MSQLLPSGSQSIGVSALNISPSNEYSGLISFRMDCLRSAGSPRDAQESSPTPQLKSINSSALRFPYSPTLTSIHDYWKNHSLDSVGTFVGKVMSLLFNMLSRLDITFVARNKLQSPSAVILEPPKIKSAMDSTVSHLFTMK